MSVARKGLGKGLGALLAENDVEDQVQSTKTEKQSSQAVGTKQFVDISKLKPNPHQPRTEFNQESLEELADSIKQQGIFTPIIVEEIGDGNYYIIAGERRTRAAKIAGLTEVPVLVEKYSDQQKAEIALIENIQREDLSPLEEAKAYHNLMTLANLNQEEVSKRVGKNRSTIANALRLLKLPEDMQKALLDGTLSAGHARAILSVVSQSDQRILFARIVGGGISVREAESLAAEMNIGKKELKVKKTPKKVVSDPDYAFLEQQMIESLSTKVNLSGNFDKGTITIEYFSRDDLDRIFEVLTK